MMFDSRLSKLTPGSGVRAVDNTEPTFLSSLAWPSLAEWVRRVRVVDPRGMRSSAFLWQILSAAPSADAVLINGSGRPRQDLAAALAILRMPGGPPVVIADCLWGAAPTTLQTLVRRMVIRLLDTERTTFCVLADDERRLFSDTWGVDPGRVKFTPYQWTLDEAAMAADTSDDGSVFAGGDSVRDHRLIVDAGDRTSAPITLAARDVPDAVAQRAAANVEVGALSPDAFDARLRSCHVVVVALRSGTTRSGGMQTYLNAMALGKPVIVTDGLGVRDYIVDGESGIVVPEDDAEALAAAIDWSLDPANAAALAAIAERGCEVALDHFTPEHYVGHLLRLADEALVASSISPATSTSSHAAPT